MFKMKNEQESSDISPKEEKLGEWVELVRQQITENRTFVLQPRTDATFLAKFIRCKKYNVDEAVKAIEKYYDNIHANLRLLEGIRPSSYVPLYNLDVLRILKHKINGCSALYCNIGNWSTKEATMRDLELAGSFVFEEVFQDASTQVNGFISMVDLNGLSFSHVRQLTYHELKFLVKCIFEMFPLRVHSLHFINTPTLFWPVHKLVMKVIPKKMQSRVHLHSDKGLVGKVLDPLCLPVSMGGVLEETEAWNDEIFQRIVSQNMCYDTYWNSAFGMQKPRRLSRKRSSMMMVS